MREELALTPEVVRKGVTDFEAAIREKAHLLPESGLKKIYAVGAGTPSSPPRRPATPFWT